MQVPESCGKFFNLNPIPHGTPLTLHSLYNSFWGAFDASREIFFDIIFKIGQVITIFFYTFLFLNLTQPQLDHFLRCRDLVFCKHLHFLCRKGYCIKIGGPQAVMCCHFWWDTGFKGTKWGNHPKIVSFFPSKSLVNGQIGKVKQFQPLRPCPPPPRM